MSNAVRIWWGPLDGMWGPANNSLDCLAVILTLTRIWKVGQVMMFWFLLEEGRSSFLEGQFRMMSLFSLPSSYGSRAQLIKNVLVLGWGQFNLMFSSPDIGFALFISRGHFWDDQEHGSSRPDFYTNVLSPQGFIWKGNNLKIALT